MHFTVTYLQEVTDVIQADSLNEAAIVAASRCSREGNMKTLSIYKIDPVAPQPPKNPTPFDRPPSGTPGAGQMRTLETDLVAIAA